MAEYDLIADQLRKRLQELKDRSREIEDDLRGALGADFSEQAIDLADDESLEGVDHVLHSEISQIERALKRMDDGVYGRCSQCGAPIGKDRLRARPIATRCIECAT